MIDLQAHS